MRFIIVGWFLTVALAFAIAGPISKVSNKKSLIDNTKLTNELPKIDEIGTDKDRSKKSTSFCVEIHPGSNEPVQCSCKNKETHYNRLQQHEVSQGVGYGASQSGQLQPPSPHSVNIIHAPAQPPQTLNIIQPAPTLHAVQFLTPQSHNPSSVQTLNFMQPATPTSDSIHQTLNFPFPPKQQEESSKPIQYEKIIERLPSEPAYKPAHEETHELVLPQPAPQPAPEVIIVPQPAPQPAPEVIVIPQAAPQPAPEVIVIPQSAPQPTPEVVTPKPAPEPIPQPTQQPEHMDSSHKSEVHVSVVTQDKNDYEEHKSQSVTTVEHLPSPIEPVHSLPSAPQHYQDQVVVVPNPILVQHQENCPSALIQVPSIRYQPSESVIQFPGSSFEQREPFHTECSCKQTHPGHSNVLVTDRSSLLRNHHDRGSKIVPMVIYPPASSSVPLAPSVSHSPYREMVPLPGQQSGMPLIISMQSVRSKEGTQEGMTGMTNTNGINDMNSENPFMGRQSLSNLKNLKEESNRQMSMMTSSDDNRQRYVRNDKNTKITDKTVESKTIVDKTTPIKLTS